MPPTLILRVMPKSPWFSPIFTASLFIFNKLSFRSPAIMIFGFTNDECIAFISFFSEPFRWCVAVYVSSDDKDPAAFIGELDRDLTVSEDALPPPDDVISYEQGYSSSRVGKSPYSIVVLEIYVRVESAFSFVSVRTIMSGLILSSVAATANILFWMLRTLSVATLIELRVAFAPPELLARSPAI